MVELYKFCSKEYNPKFGYKYLQLGTLTYFREMESTKNIADRNEGLSTMIIDYFDNKVGDISSIIHNLPIGGDYTNPKIIIKNSTFTVRAPNCYIFCLSINRNKNIIGSSFCENYDSLYKIKDINKFIQIVSSNLLLNLKIDNFKENAIEKIENESTFLSKVKLNVIHRPVLYNDLKKTYIDNSKVRYAAPIPKGWDSIFIKDKEFSKDEEYRIAFIFTYQSKNISVKETPIKVPCEEISRIIE